MSRKKIRVKDVFCGGENLFVIAGPCVIENENNTMETAEFLAKSCEKLGVGFIFKSSFLKDNRSSPENYRGPGIDKGLEILLKVKNEFNIPVTSDVHTAEQARKASTILDLVQIPAYLCMQTSLVEEAAKTQKPLNIKHGQFIAPENMRYPVEKAEKTGNNDLMITERGYTFGYNDLVVDPRSFFELGKIGYPVVFDATHSVRKYGIPSAEPEGGRKEYLSTLARAAAASGIDGLFLEVHPCPRDALCDSSSQLNTEEFEKFVGPIIQIHNLLVKGGINENIS
ncbi:3-deoxy-8-phosphooctulonate synthase [candidate division WOR-3 bacterium]|nr:3-deoxy-8-phosphooctulonate synthase [candidate division WOR-3 bacterium]